MKMRRKNEAGKEVIEIHKYASEERRKSSFNHNTETGNILGGHKCAEVEIEKVSSHYTKQILQCFFSYIT